MQITVIGTGYVGLVQSVGLATLGYKVVGIDIDSEKITKLTRGQSPIYEPGLEPLLKKALRTKQLSFTTDIISGVKSADVIFIAVGTPPADDGAVDLKYVKQAAADIGKALAQSPVKYRVIVNKSTVPIGTGDLVSLIIKKHYKKSFDVISNPEFLREGQAVNDFFHPDRIVIGLPGQAGDVASKAAVILKKLYRKLKAPILVTDIKTAELIKYASNSFLATSISFINELSWLAEAVGADATKVAEGMKLDKRIGKNAFLTIGPGFGGSCFPKDVAGLIDIARVNKLRLPLLNATQEINKQQISFIVKKLEQSLKSLRNKTIAVWGLAFKADTDDIRESPAIAVIKKLQKLGVRIQAYDPVAEGNVSLEMPQVSLNDSALGALKGADALLVMTEWPEFKNIPPAKIKKALRKSIIIDTRNMLNAPTIKKAGIRYLGVGK